MKKEKDVMDLAMRLPQIHPADMLLWIRMWAGFEPESLTDADLLTMIDLDYPDADIPDWMMTDLGVLTARNMVTVDQFRTALVYVLDNISVPST